MRNEPVSKVDREETVSQTATLHPVFDLQVREAFFEIWKLMSQSPVHSMMPLKMLEFSVLQPLSRKQYRLFRGDSGYIAFVSWALVNQQQVDAMASSSFQLSPEWKWHGGDIVCLMDVVGPDDLMPEITKVVCEQLRGARRIVVPEVLFSNGKRHLRLKELV